MNSFLIEIELKRGWNWNELAILWRIELKLSRKLGFGQRHVTHCQRVAPQLEQFHSLTAEENMSNKSKRIISSSTGRKADRIGRDRFQMIDYDRPDRLLTVLQWPRRPLDCDRKSKCHHFINLHFNLIKSTQFVKTSWIQFQFQWFTNQSRPLKPVQSSFNLSVDPRSFDLIIHELSGEVNSFISMIQRWISLVETSSIQFQSVGSQWTNNSINYHRSNDESISIGSNQSNSSRVSNRVKCNQLPVNLQPLTLSNQPDWLFSGMSPMASLLDIF